MRIGVLALQGSFAEHISHLKKAAAGVTDEEVDVVEVRTAEELSCCSALVIPGGESTCMAHIAGEDNLLAPLREYCATHPVWGTCAGMIFLAKSIQGSKKGGQSLIGNMDIVVNRNFFGNQRFSFETSMDAPAQLFSEMGVGEGLGGVAGDASKFRAVFIRAPAILMDDVDAGQDVEYLSVLTLEEPVDQVKRVAVAAKQGQLLVTAFHPELTSDLRWHALFVQMASQHEKASKGKGPQKDFPLSPLPLVEIPYLPSLA